MTTRNDQIIQTTYAGKPFTFMATWGLFSPTAIDEGTELLLRECKGKKGMRLLDLGCGYGALGIMLGKEYASPLVHLVDKDFVAVEYAKKNAKENGVLAEVYLSNGFSCVPKEAMFDVIVSNIPAKVGNELLGIFLEDAKAHLAPSGELWVVTINGLRQYIKREMSAIFGNAKKIKQSTHYTVTMARKS